MRLLWRLCIWAGRRNLCAWRHAGHWGNGAGPETIEPVHMLVGREMLLWRGQTSVIRQIGILFAGPTETMVIADETVDAKCAQQTFWDRQNMAIIHLLSC